MSKVKIKAGICGFTTLVTAAKKTAYTANLLFETDCPNWQKVHTELEGKELNVMKELFKNKQTGVLESELFELFFLLIPHVSCPVLSGALKALEVETALALKADASIVFEE